MQILLAYVLFSENATPFKDVYLYDSFFSKQASKPEREYYFVRPEFGSIIASPKNQGAWLALHSPQSGWIKGSGLNNETFESYSEEMWRTYNLTEGVCCYMVPAVSSFRDPDYYPERLVDGKLDTCWCEGVKGPGIGQWIMMPLVVLRNEGERGIQVGFGFVSGCRNCNRIKEFIVKIYHGFFIVRESCGEKDINPPYYGEDLDHGSSPFTLELEDNSDWQYVSYERIARGYFNYVKDNLSFWEATEYWVAKLTIKSVYYGKGREHTCLSEIRPLFKLNDKEYLTFDCQGRKIIIPASKVKVIEPEDNANKK